jgi:uncharacterized protein (DUF2267 family)
MPYAYRHADAEWRRFLGVAREEMALDSDNMAYTAVQGVFLAFRRRLTVQQAMDFAQILPAVPRAIFVADWQVDDASTPPGTRADWTAEARALRPHHNLTPENCVEATAIALRRTVRGADIEAALARLPDFARTFWDTPSRDPASLSPGYD